ncbi:FlaG protein [Desulfonatronum thiosulfatophilum]|uniref:FlaG protein n=1 Tax=Desulfonatronum thiosulfatophilum TaxID=617002 RepID=A0A1G6A0I6_9BACT|nr:flagellar protein FlaG [Desulfonatronum thiosulfatophilum]SDB01941.1 FlaG protein [Desulfonatronum thiosulfatophilum]
MELVSVVEKIASPSEETLLNNVEKIDEKAKMTVEPGGHGPDGISPRQAKNILMEAMDVAKDRLDGTGLNVRLKMTDKSERFQVEVYNPETKEVLRRFPPDEIIRLAESIDEMAGLIVDRSL